MQHCATWWVVAHSLKGLSKDSAAINELEYKYLCFVAASSSEQTRSGGRSETSRSLIL